MTNEASVATIFKSPRMIRPCLHNLQANYCSTKYTSVKLTDAYHNGTGSVQT